MGPFITTQLGKYRPKQETINKLHDEIDNCVENYCKCQDAWKYKFNEEYKVKSFDYEAGYLSRAIFNELFKNYFGSEVILSSIKEPLNYVELNVDNKNIIFHYDFMNSFSKKKIGLDSKILSKNLKKDKYEEVIELYQTIGNISPIVWINNKNIEFNIQKIHAAFDDRWYLLLHFYSQMWDYISKKYEISISFEKYIICTCQHLYYTEILQDLRENKLKKKSIEEVEDSEWLDWMKEWNSKIEKEHCSIIDYGNYDLSNISATIVEDMIIIIKARAKCIVALLRNIKNSGIIL